MRLPGRPSRASLQLQTTVIISSICMCVCVSRHDGSCFKAVRWGNVRIVYNPPPPPFVPVCLSFRAHHPGPRVSQARSRTGLYRNAIKNLILKREEYGYRILLSLSSVGERKSERKREDAKTQFLPLSLPLSFVRSSLSRCFSLIQLITSLLIVSKLLCDFSLWFFFKSYIIYI